MAISLALLHATGCKDTIPPQPGTFDDEASASRTGGEPLDVGVGLLDANECIADPKPEVWGYQYQCEGHFIAHVGAVHAGEPISFFIPQPALSEFGPDHEPYEQAQVIACCGEYDDLMPLREQPHVLENCLLDFRQQACRSLAIGLEQLVKSGRVPLTYRAKIIAIQNYLALHTTTCIRELVDTHALPDYLTARWDLPNNGPWAPLLRDAYVTIDLAAIFGVHAPTRGPTQCVDLNDNNARFFNDESAAALATTHTVNLDEGDADTSTASFSEDHEGNWMIDRMTLHMDALALTSGTQVQTLTDARLELYGQAQGAISTGSIYSIPASHAHFVVVGRSGDEIVTLPLTNATPITATLTSGVWAFAAFELEHQDERANTWRLPVAASTWL
jgi:hypothetical protein